MSRLLQAPPLNNSYHLEMKDQEGRWRPFYLNHQPMFPLVQAIEGKLYGVESLSLLVIVESLKEVRGEYPKGQFRFSQNVFSPVPPGYRQRLTGLIDRAARQ
jgi:hypothetical protein